MDERRGPKTLHPESLCERCAAARIVMGRATRFVLCRALAVKYPPQPVLRCPAFEPRSAESSPDAPPRGPG